MLMCVVVPDLGWSVKLHYISVLFTHHWYPPRPYELTLDMQHWLLKLWQQKTGQVY